MKITVERLINSAVEKALAAGYEKAQSDSSDCRKKTEKILSSYKGLKYRIEDLKKEIVSLENGDEPQHSKDILYQTPKSQVAKEDRLDGILAVKHRELNKNIRYAEKIEGALGQVKNDRYYDILVLKYCDGLTDADISEKIYCDPSTVRRNRARLIDKVSVLLFGVDAI